MPLDTTQRRYERMMRELRHLYRIAERLDRHPVERYSRALLEIEKEISSLESATASILR